MPAKASRARANVLLRRSARTDGAASTSASSRRLSPDLLPSPPPAPGSPEATRPCSGSVDVAGDPDDFPSRPPSPPPAVVNLVGDEDMFCVAFEDGADEDADLREPFDDDEDNDEIVEQKCNAAPQHKQKVQEEVMWKFSIFPFFLFENSDSAKIGEKTGLYVFFSFSNFLMRLRMCLRIPYMLI